MWCIVFSMYVGSWFVMGVSMIAHALFLAAVVVTVGTFETARRNPNFFDQFATALQVVQEQYIIMVKEYHWTKMMLVENTSNANT